MNDTATRDDPDAIERDIRHTQEQMSRTVDRIEDQFTARNIMNALLDKADQNGVDARMLIDGARRNPVALAMIAGGAIWLVSDSDAKLPHMPKMKGGGAQGDEDSAHRDYIACMERVEMLDGEDPVGYQRRRDLARANFFVIEQRHDEDDHSFRRRLDDASENFRAKRDAWSEGARRKRDAVRDGGRAGVRKTQELYAGNPLIGGLAAAAVGVICGTALPLTRTEQQKLAGAGHAMREKADEEKEKLVEKAEQQAQPKGDGSQPKGDGSGQPASVPPQPAMG